MEELLNIVSEEYRKYLIEVIYEGHHYFTVWGTDLVDNDIDKWLVNETGHMMLFTNLPSLQTTLNTSSCFFDNENIRKWINHSDWQNKPDSLSNFDLLLQDDFNYRHPSLIDLYYLIGVLEDFAIQRGTKR
ncbi:hypothetical protein [Chitinophaga filiformis]|uniref:Uncharacterized protein n=1 Tax=Chitinophaga filiformis TaxID=104663 RepID=A0A1G7LJQ4_CHIFI|nr:hypothetical protein [Chitinophaga filiformis]SDF49626.1 hypothetical protein SAMN04488121_10289 [Chitinophaga filiformis]